jgi:hypothetical protein
MIKNALYGTQLKFIDRGKRAIESGLLADSTEDFRMNIVVKGAGDGHRTGEAIVLQLTVRSPDATHAPALALK